MSKPQQKIFPIDKKGSTSHESDKSNNKGLGLLANGTSSKWDISVIESLSPDEWLLEIDGGQTYLVLQINDLDVIQETLRFLETNLRSGHIRAIERRHDKGSHLNLGRFGSSSVSLLWDDEEVPRCFIAVGSKARSKLRLSLEAEDIQMFVKALRQVVQDL